MSETDRRIRLLAIGTALATAVAIVAVGWLAWIAADPQYWFPGAYAAKGEPGEQGPPGSRGARGPVGPQGAAGPDVEDVQVQVDEVSGTADDLDSRVSYLESIDLESTVSDLEGRLGEVETRVDDACFELSFNTDSFGC